MIHNFLRRTSSAKVLCILTLAIMICRATPGSAQVGHLPGQSPFRDLVYKQELSLLTGYHAGSKGRAEVAPAGGQLLGVRYEIRIGGPATFTARLARVWSERTVIDPTRPDSTRSLGKRDWPIYLSDVGISINLTGQKSFWQLVPVVNGGIGVASDFSKGGDPGGYSFGTPFAFTFGGGLKWVGSGRLQLRLDISDYLYQLEYPDSYFTPPTGETTGAVLARSASKNEYTHNAVITLGASYLFSR